MTGKLGEKIAVRRFAIEIKDPKHAFASYVHTNGRIGVLLKFDNQIPDNVGKDIAMHAAAMAPKFLDKNSVDQA
jgi:elongation factor Ts